MANVVVLGGAGYVGCHTALAYREAGHHVVVVDDLSAGKAENVKSLCLHRASVNDGAAIKTILERENAELVVLCVNATAAIEREDPAGIHRVHIGAALALMEAIADSKARAIVLASSCETYGLPRTVPVMERHPQHPKAPHAWSMFIAESIIRELATINGLSFAILRFYAAVGATRECGYGGAFRSPCNPLPSILDALTQDLRPYELGGIDYPTRDGTLERELLHVSDVASALELAGRRLLLGGAPLICNLGRGRGVTLKEMLTMLRRASGRKVNIIEGVGDPDECPMLFADGHLAHKELGWKPKIGVEAAIKSALEARREN